MSENPRPNAENTAARPGISTREVPAALATLQTTNGPPPPNAASVVSDEMFANLVSASATLATQAAYIRAAASSIELPSGLASLSSFKIGRASCRERECLDV